MNPPERFDSNESAVPAQPSEGNNSGSAKPGAASSPRVPLTPRILTPSNVTLPEKTRRPRRRSLDAFDQDTYFGPRRLNPKCVVSISLFVLSVLISAAALVLGRIAATERFGGILFLLSVPVLASSIVLAIQGLRQCAKHPEFDANSRVMAILVVGFGTFFGLLIMVGLIIGLEPGSRASNTGPGESGSSGELLRFPAWQCAFRPPGPPWRRMDPHAFGRGPILAFERSEPFFFVLSADPVEAIHRDPRSWLVDWSKGERQRTATSYRLLKEGESVRNGNSGWQIESEGNYQGHDYLIVDWLLATNGMGYRLTIWGPTALASQVRGESEQLFTEFRLLAPEQTLPGPQRQ